MDINVPKKFTFTDIRWDVKTLSDKESKLIKWAPVKTNVKLLSQTVQVYPVDKNFNKSVR